MSPVAKIISAGWAVMMAAPALMLTPQQHLTQVHQDRSAKGFVYLVRSRDNSWLLMSQSLPLVCRFINQRLSNEACDSVSVTSFHDNLNRTGGRNGGYVSGRWRARTLTLAQAGEEFEKERSSFENAAVVAADRRMYETRVDDI
jgi:hypothetical protein